MKRVTILLGLVISLVSLILTLPQVKLFKLSSSPEIVQAQSASECAADDTTSWCQLQRDPQRTGYSPENLDWPITNAWAFGFAQGNINRGMPPERLYPQTQPVIANGRLFIGTEMGTFYSFNAADGTILWTYNSNGNLGPVIGTAGIAGDKVFFGSMDGKVYALNTLTGEEEWVFDSSLRTGFSTAVLLAENKVFIANRGGVYYALNQADGSIAWQTDIGSPILMSSAYDNGKIFFGASDMNVYAIDSVTGNIVWKALDGTIWGAAFKDYFPVAYNGYVFIRPLKLEGGVSGRPGIPQQVGWSDPSISTSLITYYQNNPHLKNLYAFSQPDGTEVIMPHYVANVLSGAVCPPTVDGDGMLIMPVRFDSFPTGWGRLDTNTRIITEILWDGSEASGNPDENLCVSATGRLVFIMHTMEANAQFTGTWHLERKQAQTISFYHADNNYFWSATEGGGTTPGAIANGMIYHTTQNTLNARTAAVVP